MEFFEYYSFENLCYIYNYLIIFIIRLYKLNYLYLKIYNVFKEVNLNIFSDISSKPIPLICLLYIYIIIIIINKS